MVVPHMGTPPSYLLGLVAQGVHIVPTMWANSPPTYLSMCVSVMDSPALPHHPSPAPALCPCPPIALPTPVSQSLPLSHTPSPAMTTSDGLPAQARIVCPTPRAGACKATGHQQPLQLVRTSAHPCVADGWYGWGQCVAGMVRRDDETAAEKNASAPKLNLVVRRTKFTRG